MRWTFSILAAVVLSLKLVAALQDQSNEALESVNTKRQYELSNSSLIVDLGYEVYQGYPDSSTGLNTWRGIRYAAPPTASNRWQAPQPPALNRSLLIHANAFSHKCPQGQPAPYTGNVCSIPANATTLPESCQNNTFFQKSVLGSEDCLFLNVYAAPNATNLPVLVWIHGGGYGVGDGIQDMHRVMNTNDNGFVSVAIQYRLGAFGFLSSDEVARYGVTNAGLLDQNFALQWVQRYIHLFGGDPTRVTISGESAGAGSVMLQAMAYGGTQGQELFRNAIAASPYLPMQYGYADMETTNLFYAFADVAGCSSLLPSHSYRVGSSIMDCLRGKDTLLLQYANGIMEASGPYGTYAFVPVTDGKIVQQLPSQQLLKKQVNGVNMMAGNNANEGPSLTPQNISTEEDFVNYVRTLFPLFNEDDIEKVLLYYPSTNASVDPNAPLFSTLGDTGPTALNQSGIGTGQQQRANNLYAETTFVCPSYWLAEAYAQNNHSGYKYQFSVPPGLHGMDTSWYFGPLPPGQDPGAAIAFQRMWGALIMTDNPSIPSVVANGEYNGTSTVNTTANPAANPANNWPPFSAGSPYQININQTGGTPGTQFFNTSYRGFDVPIVNEPGLVTQIDLVNAYTWEGGRGFRCDFWRSIGTIVPE